MDSNLNFEIAHSVSRENSEIFERIFIQERKKRESEHEYPSGGKRINLVYRFLSNETNDSIASVLCTLKT